jgi:hypothetical protein
LELLPIQASSIFNNTQNETLYNITNKYADSIEHERNLWKELLEVKDMIIADLKESLKQKEKE